MNKIEYNAILKYRSKGLNYTIEMSQYIDDIYSSILNSNTNIEKEAFKMFKKTIDNYISSLYFAINIKKDNETIVINKYVFLHDDIYEKYYDGDNFTPYLDMEKIEGYENFIKILKKDIKDIKATIKENLQNEIIE